MTKKILTRRQFIKLRSRLFTRNVSPQKQNSWFNRALEEVFVNNHKNWLWHWVVFVTSPESPSREDVASEKLNFRSREAYRNYFEKEKKWKKINKCLTWKTLRYFYGLIKFYGTQKVHQIMKNSENSHYDQ